MHLDTVPLVARGRALLTLDGRDVDAPAGLFVFVEHPAVRREAVAVEGDVVLAALDGGAA